MYLLTTIEINQLDILSIQPPQPREEDEEEDNLYRAEEIVWIHTREWTVEKVDRKRDGNLPTHCSSAALHPHGAEPPATSSRGERVLHFIHSKPAASHISQHCTPSTAMKSSSSRWAGMSGCNINAHSKVSDILQLQKEVVTALRSINQKQKRHIHSLRAIITKQKETVQNRMRVYHAGSSQNQKFERRVVKDGRML